MSTRRRIFLASLWLALSFVFTSSASDSAVPLSERIDQTVSDSHLGETAGLAGDYEFLRRVYLNLIGRTPTSTETKAFVENTATDKRDATMDQLLASEAFNDYFTQVLDVMFMERRTSKRVDQADWQKFLHAAVQKNWSYDRIVSEILVADGRGEQRGAAKFLLERDVEPNAVTRDIGRLLLGRDLQCAQCHDHPNISDYMQSEYYGIYAFISRSYLFEDGADNQKAYVGEKAEGETEFKSVFLPDDDASKTIPTLLEGLSLEVEPKFDGEDPYVVAPSKSAAGVPKFSRRVQLSRLITHPSNEVFAQNAVNRFWAHMMGRGLVHPVDFHHGDNPPSQPALLKTLADEFVRKGFDIRELLRQIARSETYQRSIDFPSTQDAATAGTVTARMQVLQTELDALENETPTIPDAVSEQLEQRRQQLATQDATIAQVAKQFNDLQNQRTEQQKKQDSLRKQLPPLQSQLATLNAAVAAAQKAAEAFPKDPELAKQQAAYQQRVDATAKQLETTERQLTEQDKLVETTNTQVTQQQTELVRLRSSRMGIADMVAESRGAWLVAQAQRSRHAATLHGKQQQLDSLSKHQAYLTQWNAERQLASQVEDIAKANADTPQQVAAVKASQAKSDEEIAERKRRLDELAQLKATEAKRLAERQQAIVALRQALEQALLAAETLADADLKTTATKLEAKLGTLEEEIAASSQQSNSLDAEAAMTEQQIASLEASRNELSQQLARLERQMVEWDEMKANHAAAAQETQRRADALRTSWEQRFAVRTLVPLSPEQLAGSTISALELLPSFEQAAEAEWKNKNKDKKSEEVDEGAKAKEIAESVQKRIDGVLGTYVSMFAAPGGAPQDVFSATADQALFLANDGRVQGWLNGAAGSLLGRLQSMEDAHELANELHLAILARPATEPEKQEIVSYLAEREKDRTQALREIAWGLLSSLEFRFNR